MPTFNAGDVISLSLDNNDVISVVGKAVATVTNTNGGNYTSNLSGTQSLGPYKQPTTVVLTCVSSGSYTSANDNTVNTQATYATDTSGNVTGLVGPDGAVVKIADTSYTLPPTVLRITAAQIVVGKTCKLTSVKCIVGTAITLTVYDNQTLATGSVLFSQAMSAGDEAVIPNGVQAINGIYGSFTGTATFDIGVQDVV